MISVVHWNPPRSLLAVLGVVLLLAPVACSNGADSDPGSDPDDPVEWAVEPEPLVQIGETEGDPEYLLSGVAAVRLFDDGRVAVADRSSSSIRIYRPDGTFERELGGAGDGPGEFQTFSALRLAGEDTLEVYDSGARRLTRFLANGELLETRSVEAPDGWPEIYAGTYSDRTLALGWIRQIPRGSETVTPDPIRMARFGEDGTPGDPLLESTGMRRMGSPLAFSPHFLAAMLGDTVFHTNGMEGRVEAVGPGGEVVRTFTVESEPVDLEDAVDSLRAKLEADPDDRFGYLDQLPELRETLEAEGIPAVSDLLADRSGHLWFKMYVSNTDSHWIGRPRNGGEWRVHRSDGSLAATVSPPEDFRLMEVRGDRIAGVTLDELGVERVAVLRLRR